MRKGLRIALVALGLNCICFFHGCENQDPQMSFGFPASIVTLQYDEATAPTPVGSIGMMVPKKVVSWSGWAPAADAMFLLAGAAWLWKRGGIGPTPWRCFWMVATLLNSFLVVFWLWVYLVWSPTVLLADATAAVLLIGIPLPEGMALNDIGLAVDIASRLYFVLLFAECWGLAALGGWGYRRFKSRATGVGQAEAESPVHFIGTV